MQRTNIRTPSGERGSGMNWQTGTDTDSMDKTGDSWELDSAPWWPKWEVKSESHSVVSNSLQSHGLHSPWNSAGQNTGVGSSTLLQGIFPTQRSNPGLPHCRSILYQLSHQGNPRILEWVACPFSRGSSPPRNWTRISCMADRFFTR